MFFFKKKLKELLKDIETEIERIENLHLTFFVQLFKIELKNTTLAFSGPYNKLEQFK